MTPAPLDGVAWEDLAVLIATAEHGSLSRASRALRISQSTASRRLVRIEESLGTPLFDRTASGLLLTDFGERLLPYARLIAGHMADIARLASGAEVRPQGRVRLALPDGIAAAVLMPVLGDFYNRYPDVTVDLLVGNAVVDLVRREADMALRFVRPTTGDLLLRTLGSIPLAPFVHPRLAGTPPAALRWLMLADPAGIFLETHWLAANALAEDAMRVSSWNAMFAGVRAGIGAALLSPIVAVPAGLVPVSVAAPMPAPRQLHLVYHRALRDVPRVAAVRDWLVETCGALLQSA